MPKKKNPSRNGRQVEVRRQRSTYLRNQKIPYFHGGAPDLAPGTPLISAQQASIQGISSGRYRTLRNPIAGTPYDQSKVYFTTDFEMAKGFASRILIRDVDSGIVYQRGAVYRVEPIGAIVTDPDFEGLGVSWCSPGARVLDVVDPNVMIDDYTATSFLGPHSTWNNGKPMYTPSGAFIPSDETPLNQQSTIRAIAAHPFSPFTYVQAAIHRAPSGARPLITDHPSIDIQAAEPYLVFNSYHAAAADLMREGVTFSSDYRPVLNQILGLLQTTDISDTAGFAVAQHPRDGVIGAIQVSASQIDDLAVMFVENLAVAPAWQRRGVASVLLLIAQQLITSSTVDFVAGHCDPAVGPFFAARGYTVLKPGRPIFIPTKDASALKPFNYPGRSCFYRQGPV